MSFSCAPNFTSGIFFDLLNAQRTSLSKLTTSAPFLDVLWLCPIRHVCHTLDSADGRWTVQNVHRLLNLNHFADLPQESVDHASLWQITFETVELKRPCQRHCSLLAGDSSLKAHMQQSKRCAKTTKSTPVKCTRVVSQ